MDFGNIFKILPNNSTLDSGRQVRAPVPEWFGRDESQSFREVAGIFIYTRYDIVPRTSRQSPISFGVQQLLNLPWERTLSYTHWRQEKYPVLACQSLSTLHYLLALLLSLDEKSWHCDKYTGSPLHLFCQYSPICPLLLPLPPGLRRSLLSYYSFTV